MDLLPASIQESEPAKRQMNMAESLKTRLERAMRGCNDRTVLFVCFAAILCLAYVLFFHDLGGISLWDPDEPRQAIEAREMMERSDYVHPYLNGVPYLEKPPLYPWLIIIASKIQGRLDEFSARLPSALAATALLIITFFMGRQMAGPAAGLFAAFVLAANFQFLGNARESVMDMTFALFIGLTIYLGDLAVRRDRRWLFPCALLPSVFAVLSKGPAGLLIPVAVLFLLLLCHRKLMPFFLPLIVGCLLSLGLSSIWFIIVGKAYAGEFILHQNLTRYVKGFDHIESLFYYFPKLFFNFLPWSLFLPFAIYHAWRRRLWLPLVWFTLTFLFFEFSRSKRGIYLLPLYPAMALLVGVFLKEKWGTLVKRQWGGFAIKVFAILIVLCPVLGIVAVTGASDHLSKQMGIAPVSWAPLTLLAVVGIAFLFFVITKAPRGSISALFAYTICLGFFFHSIYLPITDRGSKSVRPIVDAVAANPAHLERVYFCGFSSPAAIYYLGRPVRAALDADNLLAKGTGLTIVVKDQNGLPERFSSRFSVAQRVSYETNRYLIFTD
jgi:4-amino-4-deoxy-L-arabinose transferase-like glycosyltransferase